MKKATWMFGLGVLALGLTADRARAAEEQKGLPGPIDSLEDLQDTGKMLFKLADANNDGQISQKEATDAGHLLVGGFFFRADTNGDGALSREEIRAAREQELAQRPLLRVIIERASATPPGHAANADATSPSSPGEVRKQIMAIIDTNNDGQIQATEMRQMVQTMVQGGYAAADTNRDGQLSPAELNAAILGAARSLAQGAIRSADTDGNNQISQAEFDKALVAPAHTLFRVLDANNDGQISQQEAQQAASAIVKEIKKLQVPEPANSAKNLMKSGRNPSEVAPVPNFNPTTPKPAQPTQPAQPR